jgi:hypothetical protein
MKKRMRTRMRVTTMMVATTAAAMVEPPKLYSPHAPVIVSKTSDGYAYLTDNLESLSGVLRKPETSIIF